MGLLTTIKNTIASKINNLFTTDNDVILWRDEVTGDIFMRLSDGTDIPISDIDGFTQLGSGAPKIKMKKLTGISPAAEGGITSIAHGLTLANIIGLQVLITAVNGNSIPPALVVSAEFEYDAFIDPINVVIGLSATNSNQILSNAIVVLLTHEE